MSRAHVLIPAVPTIATACPAFGLPVRGTALGKSPFRDYVVMPAAIGALLNLSAARSVWVGYGCGLDGSGFDWHEDTAPILEATLYTADGGERWFEVWYSKATGRYYALPYADVSWHDDGKGNYAGYHPAGAFEIDARDYAALIEALGAV